MYYYNVVIYFLGTICFLLIVGVLAILVIDSILYTIGYILLILKSSNASTFKKVKFVLKSLIKVPISRLFGEHRGTTNMSGNGWTWNAYFKYTKHNYYS